MLNDVQANCVGAAMTNKSHRKGDSGLEGQGAGGARLLERWESWRWRCAGGEQRRLTRQAVTYWACIYSGAGRKTHAAGDGNRRAGTRGVERV
jgi:hypothetical protein